MGSLLAVVIRSQITLREVFYFGYNKLKRHVSGYCRKVLSTLGLWQAARGVFWGHFCAVLGGLTRFNKLFGSFWERESWPFEMWMGVFGPVFLSLMIIERLRVSSGVLGWSLDGGHGFGRGRLPPFHH